ncbi:MAG: YggT family protein [Anaerolineales bacterium]|nr:YggT family protein [Anaerolineales bacterium]
MILIVKLINILSNLITLLIIVYVVLSYFMSPFHPVRRFINNLVEPLLTPIRRVLPQTGMLDFSPMVLLILVWLLSRLLTSILL